MLCFYAILIGGLVSSPNWLILILLTAVISQFNTSLLIKRLFIQVSVIILALGLFLLIAGKDELKEGKIWSLILPYLLTLTIGVWVYPLKEIKEVSKYSQ